MSTTTGWPPGLLQDDCKKLSQWFASRIDARHVVRQVCREIRQKRMEKEMSDKQPEALLIADQCDESAKLWANEVRTRRQAAALLRAQHTEIERLASCIKHANAQAERFEREWYLRGDAIERKDALLRQAHEAIETDDWMKKQAAWVAITKELQ